MTDTTSTGETGDDMLLPELVAHLRENRTNLRQEWASRITDAHLLSAMTHQEIFSEATSVYDNYVEVLETGSVEALQHYARDLSEALRDGYSTYQGLGLGLPGARRLMDEFDIVTEVGKGTTVSMTKWR